MKKHVEIYRTKSKQDHYLVYIAGEPFLMDYKTGDIQQLFQTKAIQTEFRRMAARMTKIKIEKLPEGHRSKIEGIR